MRKIPSLLILAGVVAAGAIGLGALLSMRTFAQQDLGAQGITEAAVQQIAAITAMKQAFTPAQKKIQASLVFAAEAANGRLDPASRSAAGAAGTDSQASQTVDIRANVTDELLEAIAVAGGEVTYQSAQWGLITATLPLSSLETVGASADVKSIRSSARARTSAGSLTSQGYISHTANQVFNMGVNGAGVTVGVLSDSASPARVAALIASGDLPADTTVLPGQAGPASGSDEGAAMMEIVHDLAPGAKLIFATAFTGEAQFADNIIALRAAGAKVIVDDVSYSDEGAFQDGIVARAVNQVTASGALYFSSAGNNGSITFNNSSSWEGDFRGNGPVGGPIALLGETGTVHNFGTAAAPQNYDVLTVAFPYVGLQWSDPLEASTNDYDLFVLNSTGTTVKGYSADVQDGTQDPVEFIAPGTGCGTSAAVGYCTAAGDRLVVVLYGGAPRALRLDSFGGVLSIRAGGSTYGHNAGLNTVSTGATYWNSARTGTRPFTGAANVNENFSSDGPRKIFYNPDGSPITPGNVLFATNGGLTLQKPDIAAADGVACKTPGFFPFFGTSAAAPHAAAIAALVYSVQPGWTPAQVLTAIRSTALDSMAPGIDRDSGHGIAMAWPAVQYAFTH